MKIDITNFERTVLSSFIFDYSIFEDSLSVLNIDDFYLPSHQEIYNVMRDLYSKEIPIDEEFILKYADDTKVTKDVILDILSATPITNVGSYVEEIKEHSKKRKLGKLAIEIKNYTVNENIESEDIKTKIIQYLDSMEQYESNDYEHKAVDLIGIIQEQMENVHKNIQEEKYHTGLKALDKILDGIDSGDLVIIAARPSMGKTSLISSIVFETLRKNRGVLIESLEMSAHKIMRRLLSSYSGEFLSDLKNGYLKNPQKFNESKSFLSTSDLVIHDEPYPTFHMLQSKIKKNLRKNPNIKNVIVDHTGKIKLDGKTREDIEIGYITNGLKKIARDFNIRVFLLQQLNRSVESRENKRPLLSDLKNSGNIEEDADIVLGLYRNSYYKSKENDSFEKDYEDAEIIVLKNRDGALGTAKVIFERKTSSFKNKPAINRENIIKFSN